MALSNYILNNFKLKLMSFLLAVFMWYTISELIGNLPSGHSATRTFNKHSITAMRSAEDVRSYLVTPSEVDVVVSGKEDVVDKLTDKDVDVYINLTDVQNVDSMSRDVQVNAPDGVSAIVVKPTVRIDRIRP